MKKRILLIVCISILFVFSLTSCATVQPDIIVKSANGQKVTDFPAEVEFRYYLPENSPHIGKIYTLKEISGKFGKDYETIEIEKVEGGYKILKGDKKGFVFEKPTELNYFAILEFPTQNGTFKIYFNKKETYELFNNEFYERYNF